MGRSPSSVRSGAKLSSPAMPVSAFPGGSDGKELAFNAGDLVQSPGWEDPLEKEMATHSSVLAGRISWMEEWWATVHGVTKSRTQLSDFTFTFTFTTVSYTRKIPRVSPGYRCAGGR